MFKPGDLPRNIMQESDEVGIGQYRLYWRCRGRHQRFPVTVGKPAMLFHSTF